MMWCVDTLGGVRSDKGDLLTLGQSCRLECGAEVRN
jgi:hypothetical protein